MSSAIQDVHRYGNELADILDRLKLPSDKDQELRQALVNLAKARRELFKEEMREVVGRLFRYM